MPQRFQAVDDVSPFGAGVRLIPFNLLIALGSVAVNLVASKARIPPIYLLFTGSALQIVGIALFSFLPEEGAVPAAIYGYEVLIGFGIGMVFGMCLIIPPHVVEARDLGTFLLRNVTLLERSGANENFRGAAISGGALLQFRVFGGALGLAIASSVMNNHLTSHLRAIFGPEQLATVLQSTEAIRRFPPEVQKQVRRAFAQGYNLQMRIMIGLAGAQFLAVALLWRKRQISIVGPKNNSDEHAE